MMESFRMFFSKTWRCRSSFYGNFATANDAKLWPLSFSQGKDQSLTLDMLYIIVDMSAWCRLSVDLDVHQRIPSWSWQYDALRLSSKEVLEVGVAASMFRGVVAWAIENCHGHNGHIYNQPLDLHPSPFGTRIPMAKKAPELRCVAKQKARMCFDEGHSCPPLLWKV